MKDVVLMFYLCLCRWYEWIVRNAHKAVKSLTRQMVVRNLEIHGLTPNTCATKQKYKARKTGRALEFKKDKKQ